MTGDWLMRVLVVEYVIVALVFASEGNWPRFTYWVGASIITGSVLWMK